MALKFKIAKLEDVEEAYRGLYAEKDGAFYLQAEGVVPKDKLDEFRQSNVALKTQLDELKEKFGEIDPELYKKLVAEHDKIKNKKMLDEGKVEELIAERIKAMQTDHTKTLKALTEENTSSKTKLESLLIDNALQAEAAKAGVKTVALEDVLLRGRMRFKLKDGAAVPVSGDGKVIYGKDGTTPQSMSEWLTDLAPAAPHLFEASSGGGAQNNQANAGAGGKKTLKRADFENAPAETRASLLKDGVVLVD